MFNTTALQCEDRDNSFPKIW